MGSSSLQTTFQTSNEAECRWLYDQLIPLAPVFLAMTAAVPIWKGYLVDTDVRWQRFGDLVDDRRPEEMEHTVCQPTNVLQTEKTKADNIPRSLLAGPVIAHISHRKDLQKWKATHPSNQWTKQSNKVF